MTEQTSLIRWLWERGVGRFLLAAFVLVWAFLQEPATGIPVPEWAQQIAIAFAMLYAGSATVMAGASLRARGPDQPASDQPTKPADQEAG
ncbi:MAG: hypothetical protein ACC726_12190 [Chloroflexota bacterium]